MPGQMPTILIVDDVRSLAETYAAYLGDGTCQVAISNTGEEAMAFLAKQPPAVLILDVNLPDIDGLDILRRIKADQLPTEVIVITSKASVNLAVEAMKEGAFDFIMKPLSADRLRVTVRNALERHRMSSEIAGFKDEFYRDHFVDFIGHSLAMQTVYRIVQSAAPSNATVFVTGESGTGKELCAAAIHKLSPRRNAPFVVINCAAIPKDLLESEIFGHVRGAFTGATADRKGAALQAHGGTLFLDEIGEMEMGLQSKLLRFLQDRSVRRVGDDAARRVDVRIVCATNRDPMVEIAAGRFREDLFYRLHVIPIELPPLREREDDVVLIARHLLVEYAQQDGKKFRGFSPEAETLLLNYHWPGNIRELQNTIRRIVVLNDGEIVEAAALPAALREPPNGRSVPLFTSAEAQPALPAEQTGPQQSLEEVIRFTIESTIARCEGSIPKAAVILNVSPSTLYRRIQSWQAEAGAEPLRTPAAD